MDGRGSQIKRFNMKKPPIRQRRYLQPITWLLSFPDVWKHRVRITKINCKGLKPPYIFLGNHNAFFDFKVATAGIFPHRANYIVAIDGFIGREWLMRNVGCICKRKFTNDVTLIRQIKRVIANGDVLVIYPEARYSLCGTTSFLHESLGQLCKLMEVPVVTMITKGHHIDAPFWNLKKRKVRHTEAIMKQLFTADELRNATTDEINEAIRREFIYDDYLWQRENNILVKYNRRAEGLHKVLYKCPACYTENKMNSKGTEIFCLSCAKHWFLAENGVLSAVSGKTEFAHIPDWYEWERAEVRREVEEGTYFFETECHIDSLPNSGGYIRLGNGVLTHNMNGFLLSGVDGEGKPFTVEKPVISLYACHIEFDYLGKFGDCIDLNTINDTFYIYPHGNDFSVTKIALATEELYFDHMRRHPVKREGKTKVTVGVPE
ncbi:MAG: lysophospholipid acyltransferase family protein [Eubacteriales bacterium]|jgi:hypothetical protein|nr:lysophospholipid acyltransferase family protein [Eubacteriales bacterium]